MHPYSGASCSEDPTSLSGYPQPPVSFPADISTSSWLRPFLQTKSQSAFSLQTSMASQLRWVSRDGSLGIIREEGPVLSYRRMLPSHAHQNPMDKLTSILISPGGYCETLRQPRAANGGRGRGITLIVLEVVSRRGRRASTHDFRKISTDFSSIYVVHEVCLELVESYEATWPMLVIIREHCRRKADYRRRSGGGLGLALWT